MRCGWERSLPVGEGRRPCQLPSAELSVTSVSAGSHLAPFTVPPSSWELLGSHRACIRVCLVISGTVTGTEAAVPISEELSLVGNSSLNTLACDRPGLCHNIPIREAFLWIQN